MERLWKGFETTAEQLRATRTMGMMMVMVMVAVWTAAVARGGVKAAIGWPASDSPGTAGLW